MALGGLIMKHCNKCDTDKELSDFGVRKASPDGLAHKCKQCQKDYDTARSGDLNRVETRKAYSLTLEGKAAGRRAKKKYNENNTIKRSASIIVNNAVRDGRMKRLPCEVCGDSNRTHGHHDDYAYPLTVRWLCAAHHKKWHDENGEGLNGK